MNQTLQLMEHNDFKQDDWMRELANSKQRLKISLTNDYAFKTVFRNEKALTGLLGALLDIDVRDIVEIKVMDSFLHGEYQEDKEGILDVKVLLNHDVRINIEIQVALFPHWEERSLFYTAKYFVEGFRKGEDYENLQQTIHISILSFPFSEEDRLYSVFELRNRDNNRLYSDKISVRVLQLEKLNSATEAEQNTEVYQWAKMISAEDWGVIFKMAEQNEYMKAAADEMERINTQQEMRYLYLQREKKLHDEATIKRYYTELGVKEGIEQGIEQGADRVLNAIKMLKIEKSLEEIAEFTGFSEEYILELKGLVTSV